MHASLAFVTIAIVAQIVAGFINIRQSATSPSQCESTCTSANETFTSCLNQGGPGPCVCNEGFLNTLSNCFLCSASIEGITDFSSDQAQLDDLVSTCDALGSPLSIVTLPGQNPNRNIDTSALPSVTFPSTVPTGAGSASSAGNSPPSVTSPTSLPGGTGSTSSSAGNSVSSGMQSTPSSPVGPSDRVFPSSTSPLTQSTATSPSGSSPTNTNPAAVGNSSSSSTITAAASSGASSLSSTSLNSTSVSSSSSTSSNTPTPSPTSGASASKAISWLSTVLVGAGLVLLL